MIIYKITNKTNGKIYIGQTVKDLSARWKRHCCPSSGCTALHNAIVKYGADNFTVEQIDVACSKEELDRKEQYWIKHFNSRVPNGYNLSDGGDGCLGYKHTEEAKMRMAEARIGKGTPHTEEWKRQCSIRQLGNKHPHKGSPWSEEQRQLMSALRKGKAFPQKYKKIMCIDTQTIFDSRKQAAEWLGVYPSALSIAVKKGNRCGGYMWKYVETSNE